MMSSVLDNPLDNAWKYTSAMAQPKISVQACEVDGHSGFCVAANGASFNVADAARLFKPLKCLHRRTSFQASESAWPRCSVLCSATVGRPPLSVSTVRVPRLLWCCPTLKTLRKGDQGH